MEEGFLSQKSSTPTTLRGHEVVRAAGGLLRSKDHTSASVVLGFHGDEQSEPERQAALGRLRAALAKAPRGGPTDLVIQIPVAGGATRPGRATLDFISGWQQYTGKQVVFVASSTGEPLAFTGVVNPADPKQIFLDAPGDRNVLALLGQHSQMTKV